jgi:hypothetical protein
VSNYILQVWFLSVRSPTQQLADLLMRTARGDNASLTAVTTGRIEETLRRPPFSTARLVDEMEKKPAAPSVERGKARMRKSS